MHIGHVLLVVALLFIGAVYALDKYGVISSDLTSDIVVGAWILALVAAGIWVVWHAFVVGLKRNPYLDSYDTLPFRLAKRMIRNCTLPLIVFVGLAYFTTVTPAAIAAVAFLVPMLVHEISMADVVASLQHGEEKVLDAQEYVSNLLLLASTILLFWQYGWIVGGSFILALIAYIVTAHHGVWGVYT